MQQQEEAYGMEQGEEREPTILQIMPALPGWQAVWGDVEEPEKGQPGYRTETVVCWALVEASDGRRYVTAMMPDLESSELKLTHEADNFLGYATPNYAPNWMTMASDRRAESKSRKGTSKKAEK